MTRTLCILIVGLLAACGRGPAGGPGASNQLLVVGYDREPDTLNRFSTHILEDIQTCVIEGLTITDDHMTIQPLLAAEVPTLANRGVALRKDGGMDVTWRLRPGVHWHDGTPLSSADVKFTVDAINDPSYNPESTDGFDRISSVDTPDPLTAVVHYREVYAPYALQFTRGLLPKHVLAGRDIDRATDYNRSPLGTGPYRVAEWKSGEYIRLERVPNYWRGAQFPKIEQILFRFIANTNTRINQLKSGEVHLVAMFPWDKHREVAAIPGVSVHRTPGNAYEHVTLNQRRVAAFRDVNVRKALMHAVDRDGIASSILEGLAPVTNGPIQEVSWAHAKDVTTYAFDPAKARSLLDAAGWTDGNGDGVREKDGQPLTFTLITQAGFAVRESVSQVLQRQFRDVGVDIKVQLVDGTSISGLWFEGNFDAMLHWWQMPADPELALFFAADRVPPRGRNINYFEDEAVTSLVYAADRTVDQAERTRLLGDAQRRISELLPELPLYAITKLDAVPATLQGFKGNPTNTGVFWNVHEWEFRLIRRVAAALPLLLVISAGVFGLLHLVPGGPLAVYLSNPDVRAEDLDRLRRSLGLDQPLWRQYVQWLAGFLVGDWGYSYSDGRPVAVRVWERVPATLELVSASLLLAMLAAAPLGITPALTRWRWPDRVSSALSFAGLALPVFWFGLVLQLIFSLGLGWLPSSGRTTVGDGTLADRLAHLILPATMLAAVHAAAWSRYLRAAVHETWRRPFVAAARARGVTGRALIWQHALRPALLPVVTIVFMDAALMVAGTVVTESVFAWPGVGSLFTEALARRDYTVLMALLMVASTTVIVLNLIADVVYPLIDPRVRA